MMSDYGFARSSMVTIWDRVPTPTWPRSGRMTPPVIPSATTIS